MKAQYLMLWLSTAALPPASAVAQTHDPAIHHSVRCLIVSASLASSEDATLKMSGLMGSLFFAGQIFGAEPNIDLAGVMKREAIDIDERQTRELLVQCGGELQQRGGQISATGEALKAMSGAAH